MNKIKKNNRKIVFITLAVIGLISILVTSYSFIETNLLGNRKYVITSGLLELTMDEKDGITLSDALPVFDEVGMLGSPYEFTLTNKSKFTLKYELALKDETESEELLAYEDIRYGLTKDGVTTFGSIADLENMVIDTGTIETDKVITYQFRMWINNTVTDNEKINGKSRTLRVIINTSKSDDDILLAATLDGNPVSEFPTIEDNYGVESITCNEDVSASFNPTTWSVTVDGITNSNTSCVVNFSSNITVDQTDEAITMSKNELYAFYKGSFAGTATSSEVLSGKTVYLNGVETVGTMPNNGSVNASITTSGGSYTIPAGYHDGTGTVTGPTLENLVGTNVTLASNANLLTGYTAYGKNGVKYTGSMANNGAVSKTITPSTSAQTYTIPAGYHNGSGKVTINSIATQTSATATSADITEGKTAWVNGELVTGIRPKKTTTLTGTGTIYIYERYGTYTSIIKFSKQFDSPPKVTISAGNPSSDTISFDNVTEGSFRVIAKNVNGVTGNTDPFTWTATGVTSS